MLQRGLVYFIRDCAIVSVAAILAFARVGVTDWAAPDCVGMVLYASAEVSIIFVPEWQTKSLKRGLRGDTLPGVVHSKVALRFVEEFCDAGISPEFAKAMRACYDATVTDLREIPSLAKRRAFV